MQRQQERIEQGYIWPLTGGIHPPERKYASAAPLQRLALPKVLRVPIRQHIGAPAQLLVAVGDRVLTGQALTRGNQHGVLPVHAPTSGTVSAIADMRIAHPSGLADVCIEITADGRDEWCPLTPVSDYLAHDRATLLQHIQAAGIAGLGGAGFPTAQKLATQKPLDYLIINAVECEPYICADDRLLREHAAEVIRGTDMLMYLANCPRALIGIEDNKPEAIAALEAVLGSRRDIQLRVVPTKYPSGGEKQLIQLLTGHEVPSRGLPSDVGLLMHNVGTAYAIQRALDHGEPLIERVVTVTGEAIAKPGNYWVRLGTPVGHVLEQTGYQASTTDAKVIMGGPMMGFTLPDLSVPIVKISNCILAPSAPELPQPPAEMPCIRCGACAEVCPASLQPQQLYWHAKVSQHEQLEQQNLFDCIECGACAYVCPSAIPLVHYYRKAKAEIRNAAREKAKAEVARERFEARQQRLEREQQERLERHRQAAAARQQAQKEAAASGDSDPQAAVKAALARAKARKLAQQRATDASADPKVDNDVDTNAADEKR